MTLPVLSGMPKVWYFEYKKELKGVRLSERVSIGLVGLFLDWPSIGLPVSIIGPYIISVGLMFCVVGW